jgi:hypothetical protein
MTVYAIGSPRSQDADSGEDEYRRQTVLAVDFGSPLITGNWD